MTRIRFSLRAMLIAVTLTAVALAWTSREMQYFSRESRAVEMLRAAHAEVSTRTAGPAVLRCLLGSERFQQAKEVDFNNFSYVNRQSFHTLSDEQLAVLQPLSGVTLLRAHGALITDRSFEYLANCRDLQTLCLRSPHITGAGLFHLDCQTTLRELDLRGCPIEDDALGALTGLSQLASLNLSATNVTDKGLEVLSMLPRLRTIDLRHTCVSDAGMVAFLEKASNLKWVSLHNTYASKSAILRLRHQYPDLIIKSGIPAPNEKHRIAVGKLDLVGVTVLTTFNDDDSYWVSVPNDWLEIGNPDDLALLKDLNNVVHVSLGWVYPLGKHIGDETVLRLPSLPELRGLDLSFSEVGDKGLRHVCDIGLSSLTGLGLVGTNISDEGLKYLLRLPNLRHLDLCATNVTDAGLKYIGQMKQLSSLILTGTQVSDAGLVELHDLTTLRNLSVSRTRVTEAGVEQLKQALPHISIRYH